MIISAGRRYVFVHIPKTGGTALALALEGRAMKDDILIGDTPKARQRARRQASLRAAGRLWKHATLADIDGLLPPDVAAEMLVFTLVRNPWDRLVSYYHWLQEQKFDHPAVGLAKTLPFSDFLHHPVTIGALRKNTYGRYVAGGPGGGAEPVFVRIEHFEQDFAPIVAHLGFPVALERVNASGRAADHRRYYSPQDAAHVAALCAPDIARFGYEF